MTTKSQKNAKKLSRAPQVRPRALQSARPGACAALEALLSRSWDVPGAPWAVQNAAQSTKMQAQSRFFGIFCIFFSTSLLASIFGALNFATISTETLKISVSPRRERNFRKIDVFRLATKFHRKITSPNLRSESPNHKQIVTTRTKAQKNVEKREVK